MPLITSRQPLLLGLLCWGCQGLGTAQAAAAERVFAAEVPGGFVRVLVVSTDGSWPAGGLRIEDAGGTVLVAHVDADREAYAALDGAAQSAVSAGPHPTAGDPNATTATTIWALRLLSDWTFARAAGAAVELASALHPHAIRVVLLKAGGETDATLGPITVQKDTGPPAPVGLHAEAKPAGVTLEWQTAVQAVAVPAYAYVVQRSYDSQHEALSRHPQLLTMGTAGHSNPFVDHAPPVETTLTYQLQLVDVLGVPSAAASAQVYSPDFAAGLPPAGQIAKPGKGIVTLTWTPAANPRTGGLAVERAQLVEGPYELLTPEGLSPRSTQFEDRQVLPGASYYYRVRAVAANGALGPAADPVRAQALSATPLSAPRELAADVGQSQITLTWKPVPGASLAGYVVERRATTAAPRWARLNARLDPEARFVDLIGPSQGGSFDYRVTAVATDEGLSAPSEILHVSLVDTVPPSAPIVLATSGTDGRVQIRFTASEPVEKTAQVALLRADSSAEGGLVVGTPVNASAGAIEDTWVRGGQAYWYRLVAFDKAGNRSAETDAYEIRVATADLPTPQAPVVVYVAQPAPQVTVSFDAPPPHARVIVEVQRVDGRWKTVSGPMSGTSAVDLDSPGPHSNYRIVYVGEGGGAGVPSPVSSPK
jgi:hypothetical protein